MIKRGQKSRFFLLGTAIVALSALTACQTTAEHSTKMDRDAQIDSILERVANESSAAGQVSENLAFLDRMYKRNSDDPAIAVKYARALRESDNLQKAALVIGAFARDEELQSAPAKIEFASIQAAMGNYMMSEEFSRQAVLLDPEAGHAYHLLGIALDAQGHHKQSEVAFRKALDHWQGDPGAILNNLGLNLASQGFFDESLSILRKAKAASPNREEIERNLRIVSALQSQKRPAEAALAALLQPPKPDHKP